MGSAESNGHAPAELAPLMIPLNGEPSDILLPVKVAVTMLANLLARDDKLFTVLLGEAMTGVRLAKVLARTDHTAPDLAERPRDQLDHAAG